MALEGYFYFSEKQKETIEELRTVFGRCTHNTLCELEDDGAVCEYTEMSQEPIDYQWDDGVFLGKGIVHSVDGVRQF